MREVTLKLRQRLAVYEEALTDAIEYDDLSPGWVADAIRELRDAIRKEID